MYNSLVAIKVGLRLFPEFPVRRNIFTTGRRAGVLRATRDRGQLNY